MATMRDVAARAGVSSATVSFIVNNTKPVNDSTRARVEAAMAELGYRRNELARALASNRTRVIALAFPALRRPMSATVVTFFTSAAEAAMQRGYTLVLWPGDSETIADLAKSGMVDGIVLMEVELDDPRVASLAGLDTPFSLIGRTRDPVDHPYVDIDFEANMVAVVSRLASLGHRDIALILGDLPEEDQRNYAPAVRTIAAFREALQTYHSDGSVHYCGESAEEGRQYVSELFATRPTTTALIIWNETAAMGIVAGMKKLGKRIPEDVSVFLADSTTQLAGMTEPQLAVMLSPGTALGRMGVEALIKILEGGSGAETHELAVHTFRDGPSIGPAPTQQRRTV